MKAAFCIFEYIYDVCAYLCIYVCVVCMRKIDKECFIFLNICMMHVRIYVYVCVCSVYA